MKILLSEVRRLQELAGLQNKGTKDSGDIRSEIENEYAYGGSILSFANPDGLARIAKISPEAAKALKFLNSKMPDDAGLGDVSPKLQKLEGEILKALGIDPDELG